MLTGGSRREVLSCCINAQSVLSSALFVGIKWSCIGVRKGDLKSLNGLQRNLGAVTHPNPVGREAASDSIFILGQNAQQS